MCDLRAILKIVAMSSLIIGGGYGATYTGNYGTITLDGDISDNVTIGTSSTPGTVDTIINYGTFTTPGTSIFIDENSSSYLNNLINYGSMYTFWIGNAVNNTNNPTHIYSYGYMKAYSGNGSMDFGGNDARATLHVFHLKVDQAASSFNSTSSYTSLSDAELNSHLLITGVQTSPLSMASDGKIIISPGENFSLNEVYNYNKLVVKCNNNNISSCNGQYNSTFPTDLSPYLTTYNNGLYALTTTSSGFSISLGDTSYSSANTVYKNTLLSINTFKQKLNTTIYDRYAWNSRSSSASASSSSSFASDSDIYSASASGIYIARAQKPYNVVRVADSSSSNALRNTRTQRRSIGQGSSASSESSSESSASSESSNDGASSQNANQIASASISQQSTGSKSANQHYFFFTPFVSHSILSNGGGYSGLDYGFIGGYNGEIGRHLVGFHLGFSYGGIESDSGNIVELEDTYYAILFGLHYRYAFNYGMYLTARLEAYYFYNDFEGSFNGVAYEWANPTTIAPSASIAFGKVWDFRAGGDLGLEAGLDYTALINSKFERYAESYDSSFLNLAYFDLNLNYEIGFVRDTLLLDFVLGGKILMTPYPKVNLKVAGGQDIEIYENRYFGYFNAGLTWRIHNMFALALDYQGIFGDQMMNNAGFLSAKVFW